MRKLVTLVMTLLTMTLLSSGAVSAADPQVADQAVAPSAAQTPDAKTAPTPATAAATEQNNPHSLASRNAAALKLKAELDKLNAAQISKTN